MSIFEDELLVGSLHHVIDDIERIGDHLENLAYSVRSITGDTN